MAVELLAIADGVTSIAGKIFSGVTAFKTVKREDRVRMADLLDRIATDVLSLADQLNKKEVPERICRAILRYSLELPAQIEGVRDKTVAAQIGKDLEEVYNYKRLVGAIAAEGPGEEGMQRIKALTTKMEGAAGSIQASANILRAL